MTIGERIRKARKAKGISQLCLAMRIDASYQSYISQIERGEFTPKLATIKKIAKDLGVPVDWLINGEETA